MIINYKINYLICLCIIQFYSGLEVTAEDEVCAVNLHWSMEAEGFHRNVKYKFEIIANNTWKQCRIIIKQIVPSNLYVNKDQLEDLKRLNKVSAVVNDFVDVELPQDVSHSHYVYLFSDLNETDNSTLISEIHLPIHVRYHSPQPAGGYQSAILPSPEIFVSCAEIPPNYSSTTSNLPCSLASDNFCEYHQVDFAIDNELLEILIPVGNTDHYDTVLFMTYFITLGGTIYIYTVVLLSLPRSK